MIVVSAATSGYVMPLAVMMRSLLAYYTGPPPVSFFVVDLGLAGDERLRLEQQCAAGGAGVQWVGLEDARFAGLPNWRGMHPATYSRLFLPELLPPETPRAIWLDADVVLQADCGELWRAPFHDQALLAVQDLVIPYVSSRYGVADHQRLGLAPEAKYFNAGVMVVNLDWWRRQGVTGRVLDHLRQARDRVYFYDQEGLNAVLCGQWGELDPRWNQIAGVAGRRFLRVRHLSPEKYREVVERPWLVHFAGSWKPWNLHPRTSARALYFQYLDQTDWAGWRPPPSWNGFLRGVYDRRLRDFLYPLEHWGMRLLHRWG